MEQEFCKFRLRTRRPEFHWRKSIKFIADFTFFVLFLNKDKKHILSSITKILWQVMLETPKRPIKEARSLGQVLRIIC